MSVSTVYFSFLFCLVCAPMQECSPVHQDQNHGSDGDDSSSLPPTLLLSALDVEAVMKDEYNDVLLNMYNFFDTKLKDINVTLDESRFGTTDALTEAFDKIMECNNVPVVIKGHVRTLRSYVRKKESFSCPEETTPPPALPQLPQETPFFKQSVLQETKFCESNDRLVMVPFDLNIIKSAGLISTLNRVVSYLNKHPHEALFTDDYFDTENPLLPFLMLLTSPTVEKELKGDIKALMPHLKTTVPAISLEDYYTSDSKEVAHERVLQENYAKGNEDSSSYNTPESSIFMKVFDDINLNGEHLPQNTDHLDVDSDRKLVSRSSLRVNDNKEDNSFWPFDILKVSQEMLNDNLKRAFYTFQKHFFNAMYTIQENTKHTRDAFLQLFNAFVTHTGSDSTLNDDLATLTRYLTKPSKEDTKQSIQEITRKINEVLLTNLKTICEIYKSNSTESVVIEKIGDELVKHLKSGAEFSDNLEQDIRNLLTENCELRAFHLPYNTKNAKSLDTERVSEIRTLLDEYNVKTSEKSTGRDENQLKEDIEHLLKKYGLSSVKAPRIEHGTVHDSNTLSSNIKAVLEKLGLDGSVTEAGNSFVTIVMLPIGSTSKENVEETLKVDIRNLVEKYSHDSKIINLRKFSVPGTSTLSEEIEQLPVEIEKLTIAGCFDNLTRLYEYFKTRSYDAIILSSKNMTERGVVMRDIVEMIQRTGALNEEVKRDAECVFPFIIGNNPEQGTGRMMDYQSTANPLDFYASVVLWPIDLAQIISDGHEENLRRISAHLHNHYHDLLITTQESETQRNQIFREVLESILYSDNVKEELKNDVKIIMQYMNPTSEQPTSASRERQLSESKGAYPVDVDRIVGSGLSTNLERVLNLCRSHSCDEILEPVRNSPKRGDTFRQLLEILKSFSDTDSQLKEDIDLIAPFVLDTSEDNAPPSRRRRRSAAFTREEYL